MIGVTVWELPTCGVGVVVDNGTVGTGVSVGAGVDWFSF